MNKKLNIALSLILFPLFILAQTHSISGTIHRHNFDPVPGFELMASYNNDTTIVITDAAGDFLLSNIPTGSEVTFAYHQPYDIYEGVTILDRLVARDWLLQVLQNSTELQALAGDLTGNGVVVGLDIVLMTRLALGVEVGFTVDSLWQLMPTDFVIGSGSIPTTFTFDVTENINDFDFYAIKKGDLAIESEYSPPPPEVSIPTFILSYETFELGDTVTYDISVKDYENITGFQNTLRWETSSLELLNTIAWHPVEHPFINDLPDDGFFPFFMDQFGWGNIMIDDDEVIFSLMFKALADSNPSMPALEFADTFARPQVVWQDEQFNIFVTEGNYVLAGDTTMTAVYQVNLDEHVALYPNPSETGLIHLDYHAMVASEVTVVVYGISGSVMQKEIRSVRVGDNLLKFDWNELPIGMYVVAIDGERGVVYRKLVIGG